MVAGPGSQGIINRGKCIEQTATEFGELTASVGSGRNITESGPDTALNTNNLQITIELKNGEKDTVDFGAGSTPHSKRRWPPSRSTASAGRLFFRRRFTSSS